MKTQNQKHTNPLKVITGKDTRWSYCCVWEPKAAVNGGTPKFSVSLLIPKSDTVTVKKIKAAIEAAYREGEAKLKGNGKTVPPLTAIKTPLRDGDAERPDDPAYAGQILLQTFPLIGNYGVIGEDLEGRCCLRGYVVRECCEEPSNFRCEGTLDAFLKKNGVPLYQLARKGQAVETEARETEIRELTLGEKTGEDGYMLYVDCGSGTYIRTLCHDIGQALGAPAHMRFLLRTRHGAFDIARAATVEEVEQAAADGALESLLLPLDFPLAALPRLDLPEAYWKMGRNGAKLPAALLPELEEEKRCRIYAAGALLGVGRREQNVIRYDVGLTGGEA